MTLTRDRSCDSLVRSSSLETYYPIIVSAAFAQLSVSHLRWTLHSSIFKRNRWNERQQTSPQAARHPMCLLPEVLLGLGYLLCLHIISLMLRRPSLAMPMYGFVDSAWFARDVHILACLLS